MSGTALDALRAQQKQDGLLEYKLRVLDFLRPAFERAVRRDSPAFLVDKKTGEMKYEPGPEAQLFWRFGEALNAATTKGEVERAAAVLAAAVSPDVDVWGALVDGAIGLGPSDPQPPGASFTFTAQIVAVDGGDPVEQLLGAIGVRR